MAPNKKTLHLCLVCHPLLDDTMNSEQKMSRNVEIVILEWATVITKVSHCAQLNRVDSV